MPNNLGPGTFQAGHPKAPVSDRAVLASTLERMKSTREEIEKGLNAAMDRGTPAELLTILLVDLARAVEIMAANLLRNGQIERLAPLGESE